MDKARRHDPAAGGAPLDVTLPGRAARARRYARSSGVARVSGLLLALGMAACQVPLPPATVPGPADSVAAAPLPRPGVALPKPSAEVVRALAPTGVLRVGLYPGSPTSLVRQGRDGQPAGITLEVGTLLAATLGVPLRLVEHARVAQVLESLKAGAIDMTLTNATEARAREMLFADPLIRLELGVLVPASSRVRSLALVDQPGIRVGVSQGSSSQAALSRQYRHAQILPQASLEQVRAQLLAGQLDAFATNKGILFELASGLPDARILDGAWGHEHMAIAVSRDGPERSAVLAYLQAFGQGLRDNGMLRQMGERAGLRGVAP